MHVEKRLMNKDPNTNRKKKLVLNLVYISACVIFLGLYSFSQIYFNFAYWFDKGDKAKTPDDEIFCYTKAIKKWGEHNGKKLEAAAYYNRGLAYFKKGSSDKEIEDYNTALELNPEYKEAYFNRGNLYAAKGIYDKAVEDYRHAVAIDPKDADTYYCRGYAYFYEGDNDMARADFEKAKELNPQKYKVYYSRQGRTKNSVGRKI